MLDSRNFLLRDHIDSKLMCGLKLYIEGEDLPQDYQPQDGELDRQQLINVDNEGRKLFEDTTGLKPFDALEVVMLFPDIELPVTQVVDKRKFTELFIELVGKEYILQYLK